MPTQPAGFREKEHTADWELDVWAPDLPALLDQAARGMYWLMGAQLEEGCAPAAQPAILRRG